MIAGIADPFFVGLVGGYLDLDYVRLTLEQWKVTGAFKQKFIQNG